MSTARIVSKMMVIGYASLVSGWAYAVIRTIKEDQGEWKGKKEWEKINPGKDYWIEKCKERNPGKDCMYETKRSDYVWRGPGL